MNRRDFLRGASAVSLPVFSFRDFTDNLSRIPEFGKVQPIPEWINTTPLQASITTKRPDLIALQLETTTEKNIPQDPYAFHGIKRKGLTGKPIEHSMTYAEESSDKIEIEFSEKVPSDGKLSFQIFIRNNGKLSYLTESGLLSQSGPHLLKIPPPYSVTPRMGKGFTRSKEDGIYKVKYETLASGAVWETTYAIGESAYTKSIERNHSFIKTYEESLDNPHAKAIAQAISKDSLGKVWFGHSSLENGVEIKGLSEYKKFKLAVRLVQGLEYNKEEKGYLEYPRTVEETILEGKGDCDDTTFLLSGILESPPFNYDTGIVITPAHMLPAVKKSDIAELRRPLRVQDHTWDTVNINGEPFVPIETTNWSKIGRFTEEEKDEIVAKYYNGEFYDISIEGIKDQIIASLNYIIEREL